MLYYWVQTVIENKHNIDIMVMNHKNNIDIIVMNHKHNIDITVMKNILNRGKTVIHDNHNSRYKLLFVIIVIL